MRRFPLAFVLATVSASVASAAPTNGPDPTFLRLFAETRGFTLGRPTRIRPTPDGKSVLFLRSAPRDPTLGLYEFDVASGVTRELCTPAQLLPGAEEELSVAEKARRERMRVTDRGFTAFELSDDGKRILLPLGGRLYVYERGGGKIRSLGDSAVPILDPRLSPDGSRIGYAKGQDVYAVDVATGKETRVTRGGTEEVTHGIAEFVAQEEMQRFEGWWWSPDGKSVAYTEVDHAGLERFTIADPARPGKLPDTFPYPRPGKPNAKVRLGITAAGGTGKTVWVKWDAARYPYLARVVWKEKTAPLTILVQARDQREEALLAVDTRTGATRTLLVETDEAWLNLDRDTPRWLPDGSGFLFTSDKSGRRALELHKADGSVSRVLSHGQGALVGLVHVSPDADVVHVTCGTPLASRIVRIPLGGGEPVALTTGPADHTPVFAKDGSIYVDTQVAADALPDTTVHAANDGRLLGRLPSVAEPPPFLPRLELTTVGDKAFNAAVLRPRDFQKGRRYPVIVNVYGGPTSLMVRADQRMYLLGQWIADHGAIVVAIDNRGTPRRDRAWERVIQGNFGRVPLDDQAAGLQALGARYPEIDLARAGIFGWSFGGYMAALAVLRRPDVWKATVAGAPVVDWRDYDTHYTERYLGTPETNPAGYDESSLLTYAPSLSRPLLLVHGTSDDNVYFFHTLKLADALFKAGRPFELLPLSGFTHQVPDPNVRQRLWERIVGFLMEKLH